MSSDAIRRPGGLAPRDRRSEDPSAGRRRSDAVWATLIAALPHELRRSLGVISLLSDGLGTGPEAGRQIALEVRRIDRLIDAMTEVSRITTSGEAVSLEPLAPSRVLAAAAIAFARDPDGCDVSVARDDSLPVVRGNAVLTEMILVNLLSNASRYGAPPVVLDAARAGSVVQLSVHDAGTGFRDEPRAPRPPGMPPVAGPMGVGLAISRLFASAMAGWIDVDTGPSGSRVSLCLPIASTR